MPLRRIVQPRVLQRRKYQGRTIRLAAAGSVLTLLAACSSETGPVPTPAAAESAITTDATSRSTAVISWVGDTILGTDVDFGGGTLPALWEQSGRSPDYFFANVEEYFGNDSLTVANFEVALTDSQNERYKGEGETYHFFGEPALAETLTAGGVDAVTVSNNHTWDYGQAGFDDTLAALDAAGVDYFGVGSDTEGSEYDYQLLREVDGIKVGLLGYQAWQDMPELREQVRRDIASLRDRGAVAVIPYFHWGIESDYEPYDVQVSLAHAAIDAGADAVIGTHPHVLQSMEIYRGKLIAYSLGNFAFGGNTDPTDKRTMILQTQLTTGDDGALNQVDFRVIPTRLSSTETYNDYVPTPYTGARRTEVLEFINGLSPTLNGRAGTEFVPVTVD